MKRRRKEPREFSFIGCVAFLSAIFTASSTFPPISVAAFPHVSHLNADTTRRTLSIRRLATLDTDDGGNGKFDRVFGDRSSGLFTPSEELQLIEHWGLTRNADSQTLPPECPHTVSDVVEGAFAAIAGTLYNKQQPDPALHADKESPSLFAYRPIRSPSEAGRIGIEIDGTEFLFKDLRIGGGSELTRDMQRRRQLLQGRAQRRFSLMLAMKLASDKSWSGFERRKSKRTVSATPSYRPVALSFNTLKEALAASREMQYLQTVMSHVDERVFDHIIIQTISDGVPKPLHKATKKKRFARIKEPRVDSTKGILLLCSPTDYSREYEPPGPSLHSIPDFQKVTAMSLLHETPVVVVSPRFLSYDEGAAQSIESNINQNAYQQAGYFGGKEPPRGMSPWVLRDFFPPSYCWIGNALAEGEENDGFGAPPTPRVIMTNSVMNSEHPWHIFGSEERHRRHNTEFDHRGQGGIDLFHFVGSTKSVAGRPTRALLQHLLLTDR